MAGTFNTSNQSFQLAQARQILAARGISPMQYKHLSFLEIIRLAGLSK